METTIDFLRHGEVKGGNYFRGITDDPLTNLGWQQMHESASNRQWEQIISSPLRRCQDFSQQISEKTDTPFCIDTTWQEINFGDWEGKFAHQIAPSSITKFYQNPTSYTPPNGEAFLDFQSRINRAWKKLLTDHQDKKVLVITHAGVIRCLFTLLLDLPHSKLFNLQVDHGSLTQFHCFHDNPENFVSLAFHNKKANII